MTRLAQSIAADRQRLGMSQTELARLVGVTQQSIAKWEAGSATPRGKRLSGLVHALGKKSHTAETIELILQRGNPAVAQEVAQMAQTTPLSPMTQTQALATLARAAQDLAQAAKAIAESVQKLAPPATTKQ